MPAFRCVILAAVSSTAQVADLAGDEKESIPYQLRRGREIIEARGWSEVAEPLVIPGQSRSLNWLHEALEQIDAYRQLRDLADARRIDLVICRNYDRLARTSTLQQQVSAYLKERGVQIYALEMPVEPHDPRSWRPRSDSTRLWVEAIAGAQSESYVNQLSNFHRFGMEGRTKKGWHAEGTPVYGYRDIVTPDGYGKIPKKRVPDPETFPVAQRIFRMLLDGKTGVYVMRWLNGIADNPGGTRAPIPSARGGLWSTQAVVSLARNPFYAGKVARYRFTLSQDGRRRRKSTREQPGLLVDGVHEPAILWEEWLRVQEILTARGKVAPRLRRRDYLWSGLAVCGYCLDRGEAAPSMRYCHDKQANLDGRVRHYEYLVCSHYSVSSGTYCQRNYIPIDAFCTAVKEWLHAVLSDPRLIERAAAGDEDDPHQPIRADLARVDEAIARLSGEERRWDQAYRQGVISLERYGQGLQDMQQQRQRAELERATLASALERASSAELRRAQRDRALADLRSIEIDPADPAVVRLIHQVLAQIQIRSRILTFVPY
jgi:DNA invertase Pin-like site-specific DNA recombinase